AAHIKGLVLKSRLDYVKQFYGEKGLQLLIESLPPEGQDTIRDGVLVSTWYPLDKAIEILVAIDEIFGKGDFELMRKIGGFTARVALAGGVQQSFVRQNDPGFVLKMAPIIFQQYYDSGRIEIESKGEESAVARVFDFALPHRVICSGLLGWIEEAIEIWGGTQVKVSETKCCCKGDPHCEFVVCWVTPVAPEA
ncbi:MAG: 4-vinyl reductase, partial [Deltaproteobacteria bacterium]|nr:4-vinyl reductase [Deltaproteobacteria bacterium]